MMKPEKTTVGENREMYHKCKYFLKLFFLQCDYLQMDKNRVK